MDRTSTLLIATAIIGSVAIILIRAIVIMNKKSKIRNGNQVVSKQNQSQTRISNNKRTRRCRELDFFRTMINIL
jgi:hypothetical protein